MAWLARLDARTARWPWPFRGPYLAVRWFLLLMGIYMGFGLAIVELSEKRVGLGLGLSMAMIYAVVGGLAEAYRRLRS